MLNALHECASRCHLSCHGWIRRPWDRAFASTNLPATVSKRKQRQLRNTIHRGDVGFRNSGEYVSLIRELKEKAKSLGLGPLIGITDASPSSRIELYKKWVEMNMNGDMRFLARKDRIQRRENLELLLPQVQSIIVCTLMYWPGKSAFRNNPRDVGRTQRTGDPLRGIISSYAWGEDYHSIMESKLHTLAEWLHTKVGPDFPFMAPCHFPLSVQVSSFY
jgi:epoxyqueuosine reductase QueG